MWIKRQSQQRSSSTTSKLLDQRFNNHHWATILAPIFSLRIERPLKGTFEIKVVLESKQLCIK
jgi:hypothetical protein